MSFKTFRVIREMSEDVPGLGNVSLKPGQLVTIDHRMVAKKLLREGKIGPAVQSHVSDDYKGEIAQPFTARLRFGIFMHTSPHYSGGRIHIFQYALTLAQMGHTVYIATNRLPLWANDYPKDQNLHFLFGVSKMPPDLDVVVTDPKNEWGRAAMGYRRKHPRSRLVCFNFETPNWVNEFAPETAKKMAAPDWEVFDLCDLVVCNSSESVKYFVEWLGYSKPCAVLWPAVNTHALDQCEQSTARIPDRPYVVLSARSSSYKQSDLVVDTIFSLDQPFDVVAFGYAGTSRPDTENHAVHRMTKAPDVDKYKLIKHAHLVCAPSLFEGFGMVPGEALCSGKQVLCMDLPVLRQNYGRRLIYSEWGNRKAYAEKLRELCNTPDLETPPDPRDRYGLEAMPDQIGAMRFHPSRGRPKVFAHMIAYWGFIPESITAIYDQVDEVLVAFGRTPNAMVLDDGSLDRLLAIPDPDNKIKIEHREVWRDKLEMRDWCTRESSGDYQVIVDGDEVYVGLDKWLEAGIQYGGPRWVHFWHDQNHWIHDHGKNAGLRWGYKMAPYGSSNPHYRTSYWRRSYRFVKHCTPRDAGGGPLCATDKEITAQVPECWIAHLGHALPRPIMEAKHKFYKSRDGDDAGRKMRQDCWHNWSGEVGVLGDGIVDRVDWELPQVVKAAFCSLEEMRIRNEP